MVRKQPLVSIVIVSYNTKQLLHDCLVSLHCVSNSLPHEIVVVDNASTDGSVTMVRESFPYVHLICNQDNVGFGVANNQGVAIAKGHYILLLNSDTIVWPGSIEGLISHLEQHPTVGMVGPRLLNPDGSAQRSAFRFLRPSVLLLEQLGVARLLPMLDYRQQVRRAKRPILVEWLLGACVLARRDLLAALGPFDPRFFMYAEDIDLCYRVRAAGWEIQLVPDVVVTHLGGMSARRQHLRMALQSTASMYLFYQKHYGSWALLLAVLIFRGVAIAKWLRDFSHWLWLALLVREPEQRRQLIKDLRLWREVIQLRPPLLTRYQNIQ